MILKNKKMRYQTNPEEVIVFKWKNITSLKALKAWCKENHLSFDNAFSIGVESILYIDQNSLAVGQNNYIVLFPNSEMLPFTPDEFKQKFKEIE